MQNFRSEIKTNVFICLGLIFLFTLINHINLKNYYNEKFNQFTSQEDNFDEKVKIENSRPITEGSEPEKPKLNSLSALLMDGENKRVLYEINGFKEMPMASTTKIMTCIIALEEGNLSDVVNVSSYAARMPNVQLNIRTGERYYLKDLLYSLMLESHNDVAVAIAEHIGGTVEGFATMMNDKARELDCKNTNFVTSNGLDADGHYTSARDLAVIAAYAIENKDFLSITNTASYQFKEVDNKRNFSISNKNKFLYMMDGAIGIKTGFTGKAGYCFVGAVKRLDRTLISVVLGCGWPPSKSLKWTDTKRLMSFGIDNYEKKQIFEQVELAPVYVEDGQNSLLSLNLQGDLNLLLRHDEVVRIDYNVPQQLLAPIDAKQKVGSVKYYIDENLYADIPILTSDASKKIDYKFCFLRIIKLWSQQY